MHIQIAKEGDIPALIDLLFVLFSQEKEFNPDSAAQERGLTRIIQDRELGAVLVAKKENKVVGMVNLLFTVSTALGERVALLEDMVVIPAARGSGVGSALLAEAMEFARKQGCKRITLLTDRDNEAAQRFYAKQGFSVSGMVPMRLSLA